MSGGAGRILGVLLINSSGIVGFHSSYNEGSLASGQYLPIIATWKVA